MKLETKHLAAYLPYGLKVTFEADEYNHEVVGLNISREGLELISPFGDYGRAEISISKPILRPLSDLTKEIKHNGIKLIPAIEIAKRVDNGHSYDSIVRQYSGLISIITDKCDDIENVNINLSHNGLIYSIRRRGENIMFSTYQTIKNLLLSWHFDIFGLIEAGLAIDINSLDN